MRNIYFTICAIGFLAIDILSKYIVESYLKTEIVLVDGWISLERFYNTGIAFSIAVPSLILKILTVVLIFGIILYYFRERKEENFGWEDIGFALIIGGAIGNGVERIFQGYVVDFVSVSYFAVFNIADTWISLGAVILIYLHYVKK